MNHTTLIELGKKKQELFDELLSASRRLSLSNQVDEMAEWLTKREKLLDDVKKTDESITDAETRLRTSLRKQVPELCDTMKETLSSISANDAMILNRIHGKMGEIQKEQKELSHSSKVKNYLKSAGIAS